MKRWYRVTLDLAYEGDVLDKYGNVVTDPKQAKEILTRIVSLDIGAGLRKTAAGPVDWDIVDAKPREEAS